MRKMPFDIQTKLLLRLSDLGEATTHELAKNIKPAHNYIYGAKGLGDPALKHIVESYQFYGKLGKRIRKKSNKCFKLKVSRPAFERLWKYMQEKGVILQFIKTRYFKKAYRFYLYLMFMEASFLTTHTTNDSVAKKAMKQELYATEKLDDAWEQYYGYHPKLAASEVYRYTTNPHLVPEVYWKPETIKMVMSLDLDLVDKYISERLPNVKKTEVPTYLYKRFLQPWIEMTEHMMPKKESVFTREQLKEFHRIDHELWLEEIKELEKTLPKTRKGRSIKGRKA